MSLDDIAIQCNGFLVKAFVDAGFTIQGGNASMLILANSVADDLFTYFKTLSIKEAILSVIWDGIRILLADLLKAALSVLKTASFGSLVCLPKTPSPIRFSSECAGVRASSLM
jgi:hypothetical protein